MRTTHYSQIIAAAAEAQYRYAVRLERRGKIGRYSYSINEAYRRSTLLEEIAAAAASS